MRTVFAIVIVAVAAAGIFVSCGAPASKTISQTRVVKPEQPPAAPAAAQSPHGAMMPPPPSTDLQCTQPEGWTSKPPTSMRMLNLQAGSSPEAECFVCELAGSGGGVDQNLNRWRTQMGQPELSSAELAALPKVRVLGKDCPLIEISGTYAGMSGGAQQNFYLAGVVCLLDTKAIFVKMTGPEAQTRPELERFKAFCQSLH